MTIGLHLSLKYSFLMKLYPLADSKMVEFEQSSFLEISTVELFTQVTNIKLENWVEALNWWFILLLISKL